MATWCRPLEAGPSFPTDAVKTVRSTTAGAKAHRHRDNEPPRPWGEARSGLSVHGCA